MHPSLIRNGAGRRPDRSPPAALLREGLAPALFIAAVVAMTPSFAFAYVGPGAGLSVFASLMALIGGIFLGIVGFIWYPIKRLLRAFKQRSAPAED